MKPASNKLGLVLLLALGPLFFAGLDGCGGDRCEPGYYLEHHVCYQNASSAGAAGETGSAGAPSCDDPGLSTYGVDCRLSSECVCDSDFCAAAPGSVGFCTRTGCDTDPSVCPDGHSCTDLSSFGPGLPSICVPP